MDISVRLSGYMTATVGEWGGEIWADITSENGSSARIFVRTRSAAQRIADAINAAFDEAV